jgi:hypothetical protein
MADELEKNSKQAAVAQLKYFLEINLEGPVRVHVALVGDRTEHL